MTLLLIAAGAVVLVLILIAIKQDRRRQRAERFVANAREARKEWALYPERILARDEWIEMTYREALDKEAGGDDGFRRRCREAREMESGEDAHCILCASLSDLRLGYVLGTQHWVCLTCAVTTRNGVRLS